MGSFMSMLMIMVATTRFGQLQELLVLEVISLNKGEGMPSFYSIRPNNLPEALPKILFRIFYLDCPFYQHRYHVWTWVEMQKYRVLCQ